MLNECFSVCNPTFIKQLHLCLNHLHLVYTTKIVFQHKRGDDEIQLKLYCNHYINHRDNCNECRASSLFISACLQFLIQNQTLKSWNFMKCDHLSWTAVIRSCEEDGPDLESLILTNTPTILKLLYTGSRAGLFTVTSLFLSFCLFVYLSLSCCLTGHWCQALGTITYFPVVFSCHIPAGQ